MGKRNCFTSAPFMTPKRRRLIRSAEPRNLIRLIALWLTLATILTAGLPVQKAAGPLNNKSEADALRVIDFDSDNELTTTEISELLSSASDEGHRSVKDESRGKADRYRVLQIEYRSVAARRAKFTDAKISRVAGVMVLTAVDRFADVFVEIENSRALSRLVTDPNVLRWELAANVSVPPPTTPPSARYTVKGIPETIVRDGFTDAGGKKWTGKKVVVAVIDTGADVRHPDFIKEDEDGNPTSRFEYFWDTTLEFRPGRGARAPFSYPNGTSIGTLFHQKHLTEELKAIKKGAPPSIPPTDEDGHGTACASIAAGNGNADQCDSGLKRDEVIGVAPDALLIGVRIGKSGAKLKNGYLLNAVSEWLDRVAGARPLVSSVSFGSNATGHDGQSINERELNARFGYGERRGRAMVVASGNESRKAIHARVTFGGIDSAKLVTWEAKVPTVIRLFFNSPSSQDLKIIPLGDTKIEAGQLRWELNRITNQVQATLSVAAGPGSIRLFNKAGEKTEAHLYFAGPSAGKFNEGVDNNYLVSSPGTARDLITVGSYDWNDNFHLDGASTLLASTCRRDDGGTIMLEIGVLSCYSSQGPTRDNRYKPDIVAPGEWYTASYSAGARDWVVDTTGRYAAMNGTSAATPYTAGVLALLFERAPDLTVNRIKRLLRENSTKTGLKPSYDGFPNAAWGSGKLDITAVERMFESLSKSEATE